MQMQHSYQYDGDSAMGTLTTKWPRDVKRQRFYITKKTIQNLPQHERREKIHEAEVVLAFPVDDDLEVSRSLKVFAHCSHP